MLTHWPMTTAVQNAPLTAAVISVPLILAFKSSSGSAAAPVPAASPLRWSSWMIISRRLLIGYLLSKKKKFDRSSFRAPHVFYVQLSERYIFSSFSNILISFRISKEIFSVDQVLEHKIYKSYIKKQFNKHEQEENAKIL